MRTQINENRNLNSTSQSRSLMGYGTFFYPHIFLRTTSEGRQDEVKQSQDNVILFDPALDVSFEEWRAIVYKNGFIVITFSNECTKNRESGNSLKDHMAWLDEKLERGKVSEILNLIFALSGLRFHATNYGALLKVALDADTARIVDCAIRVHSLRELPLVDGELADVERDQVNAERIDKALLQAASLLQERNSEKSKKRKDRKVTLFCERLLFLLQAETHHANSEHAQSFILSWIVMEHYINELWEKQLAQEEKNDNRKPKRKVKDRFSKLRNFSTYTTDVKLETLKLTGRLTLDQYDLLMAFKEVRNDIAHEGQTVTSEQAYNILFIASMLVGKGVDLTVSKEMTLTVANSEGNVLESFNFPDVPFMRLGIDVQQNKNI